MLRLFFLAALIAIATVCLGCQQDTVETIKIFPLDTLTGVLTQSGISLDKSISSDGKGSLRIDAIGQTIVRLFEIQDISIDDARLTFRAKLKTKDIQGQVYLEMRCSFPGMGEYSSRSMNDPLSGTVDWTTVATPFILKKDQRPELIKLNVVITGSGTVWIDDISLVKGPLK